MRRKKVWFRVGFVLAGLVIAYWLGCASMAQGYVSPIRLKSGDIFDGFTEQNIAYKNYQIPTWVGGSQTNDYFILVHGYGGTRGYWRDIAPLLAGRGTVYIPSTMGQSESPAKQVGFGKGESSEIIAIAEAIRAKDSSARIHLLGVSMGGAATWLAAGDRPDLISSVTSEASFAQLDWGSDDFLSVNVPGGARLFRPIIWIAERKVGIKGSEVSPAQAAAKFKGPSIIMQSHGDIMFGARHCDSIAQATNSRVTWFEGYKHAEIFQDEAERVDEMIGDMISKLPQVN
ncbi:MAG: alpha/beta fold hydrolase [Fimbriimonadaceae bacterium]|nr:alpha/beta fold hydrolase [Fimbriimonadaceae bacterium]